MNNAQQVYVAKGETWARFVNGTPVVAWKDCPGDLNEYRRINVAGDEVKADNGMQLLIEKHY